MSVGTDYDVVIVGGGMVGVSQALLLACHSREQLRVMIVESFPLALRNGNSQTPAPVYSPSFDARSTALSHGSRLIMEPMGLWPLLNKHLAAIKSVHVSSRGHFGATRLRCEDVSWPSLGYVVENAWLGNVLLNELQKKSNVDFCAPAAVKAIAPHRGRVDLDIEAKNNDKRVTAQLAIVADGANSSLREQLGIDTATNDYQQTALIANVCFRKSHQGCAYERFTSQGPVALLPLTDSEEHGPRAALVWSLAKEQADYFATCGETEFLTQLQQRFGHRLGEFTRVGNRFTYPLTLVQAREQVRSGIVVIGNAAHALHPVAGQGFNLALRDCARLTQILTTAHADKAYLGKLSLLQMYVQQQQFDQQKTVVFSDRLPALFSRRQLPLSVLRGIGLSALDIIPALKSTFIHHAAGVNDGAAVGVR